MASIVGTKGQVVISKEIRDELGIEPGWLAVQTLSGDHVEIRFLPPPHRRSLRGALSSHIKTTLPDDASWNRARGRAWSRAAKDKENNVA